ncbi:MAG: hypothetical protein A2428_16765 [Bdellovibrionales bacterium RIFOXYC1_FULL_54_43]|nr:MAG: hypothetical protein A2428_16765 [Bdellovibrionales bacterium RIFOXYC1_FULL_54_43]OFZ84414.1 MAG: hypothetical protein A2603_03175 [Bdellovibrionales bacterium RIFOXYD1_FULL_55_31]
MTYRWEPKTIDINFCDMKKVEQWTRLEELADILYSYFCQLERESQSETTVAVCSSIERRTGTDG